MNKNLQKLRGETIKMEISGKKFFFGTLVDTGIDVVVIFNGKDFVYLPIIHIQSCKVNTTENEEISLPVDSPGIEAEEELSLRKTLLSAKGMFTEIYVTGNQPLHGYITKVMNNYFEFYSPVYKTMYIPLFHLKWIIPYTDNQTPYGLSNKDLPVHPSNLSLARTFDVQVEKLVGSLIIFNIGENPNFIGQINKIEDNFVELITAREEPVYLNLHHIRTVHLP
ncbi:MULTISPECIES: DUF2642 domain-containing protein [unclassified Bacillus (in: firmicutes)]|uniref:DUF2642 domain-containing protein n=1 Tax=unclassified Bacillus (in: firmicutes) TaxID=185979 RepID=UPI001BEB33B1|nr:MULTISPECIES: DUF2642 domain-containing protein [unclassified Bacillus (in: firmicutes)]MBT2617379.1 DUF2642 domain-containing protein [Bacillus sp. ISL-78]MBT2630929.1 DUF2642 domain-containing protein [Bacillus sp. ISL-101]